MQRENKWQDIKENTPYEVKISLSIKEIETIIQEQVDTARAEEREKTLREIHDWAYRKGSELIHEDRIKGFQAVVDYTKQLWKKITINNNE